MSKTLIGDIEANGLLDEADKMHVMCLRERHTGSVTSYFDRDWTLNFGSDGLAADALNSADTLVFHNGLSYDMPLLEKLYGYKYEGRLVDTLLLSKLLNPDRPPVKGVRGGPHSIEAWGVRVGHHKPEHDDWSEYSPEMQHRCEEDTFIGELVLDELLKETGVGDPANLGRWELAYTIEAKVRQIIDEQERNGVYFDTDKAKEYVEWLENKLDELYQQIRPFLRKEVSTGGYKVPVNKPFLKNGSHSATVIRWFDGNIPDIGGPFTRVEFLEPDIGSRQKLTKQLLYLGWKPIEYTEKGNPRITEESLEAMDTPALKLISEWYSYRQRLSTIRGWLKNPRLKVDHRLPASADTLGTNTGRFRHSVVVNVPKAKPNVLFGTEMRSLFTVPVGSEMVGCDASGLEARMEAHYTYPYQGGKEYADEILNGDIHNKNVPYFFERFVEDEEIGTPRWESFRDITKNCKYALTYGCFPPKLRETMNQHPEASYSTKEAQNIWDSFWSGGGPLALLRDDVNRSYNKDGYLVGLDGRKVYPRGEHSALNTLFQSGGAIVMKVALLFLDKWLRELNLKDVVKFVINMHDEFQMEVKKDEELIEKVKELSVRSIVQAGKFLKLNVPLDGDAKSGSNWAETH